MEPNLPIAAEVNVFGITHRDGVSCARSSLKFPRTRRTKAYKVPRTILVLFPVLIFLCKEMQATEVIMIVSGDHIVIAADSLTLGDDGPRFSCKVEDSKGIYWAAAGLYGHRAGGYDVRTFLNKAANKKYSVQEMLDLAGVGLLPALQKEMPWIKLQLPWFYARISQGKFILMLIAARETGVGLESYVKEFSVSNDEVSTQPARPCSRVKGCIFYTGLPELKQYIATHHHEVWEVDDVSAIDNMMAVAARADPGTIGGPISILRVAPNDTRWLRQNDCPGILRDRPNKERSPKRRSR